MLVLTMVIRMVVYTQVFRNWVLKSRLDWVFAQITAASGSPHQTPSSGLSWASGGLAPLNLGSLGATAITEDSSPQALAVVVGV